MLVLYGDSMLSGFPTSRHIPASCIAPHTTISDQPLVSVPRAMSEDGIDVECCALPGHTSAQALEWAQEVPQWHSAPSIIWVGHNDFRDRCRKTSDNIRELVSMLTGEWWVLAIPVLEGQDDRVTMFDRANAELKLWAGKRFIEPIRSVCGSPVLPAHLRLQGDRIHANSDGNRLIARWLIANTIGATAQTQAA